MCEKRRYGIFTIDSFNYWHPHYQLEVTPEKEQNLEEELKPPVYIPRGIRDNKECKDKRCPYHDHDSLPDHAIEPDGFSEKQKKHIKKYHPDR